MLKSDNNRPKPGQPKLGTCPQCAKPAVLDDSNRWRPFCSRECKLVDFGDWLDEFGLDDEAAPPGAPHDKLS